MNWKNQLAYSEFLSVQMASYGFRYKNQISCLNKREEISISNIEFKFPRIVGKPSSAPCTITIVVHGFYNMCFYLLFFAFAHIFGTQEKSRFFIRFFTVFLQAYHKKMQIIKRESDKESYARISSAHRVFSLTDSFSCSLFYCLPPPPKLIRFEDDIDML